MNITTSVLAGVAALALGGGVFASQATASPTPAPGPSATATAAADKLVQARVIWFYTALTDVQRACLADANLQRPDGKLTEAQRSTLQAQIRAALTKCDVNLPGRLADRAGFGFGWAALTSDQQHCLADAELTRPVGRLTEAERGAVRQAELDAAATCGIA